MPAGWSLYKACHYGPDRDRATWTYRSPRANYQLTIRIEHDRGKPLKDVAQKRWQRVVAQAQEVEVVKDENSVVEGRELHVHMARAVSVRKENPHPMAIMSLTTRSPSRKIILGILLRATGEKLDDFLEVVEKIASSLDLKDPKQVLRPVTPAAQAGARR
jgi:hypothetical protein